ncbi:hypothetical protein C4568_02845 [Candidatus Parcubacteria bacterium]|nr:MAG: hypothetical protein C4568_02845 [Candidatus Parcubacteria bacterium]
MDVPSCVLIVPDGNRRWARANGLSVVEGHTQGLLVNTRQLANAAYNLGIKHMVFLWATEANFQKRQSEVPHLLNLFNQELLYQTCGRGRCARFRVCGNWADYIDSHENKRLQALVDKAERAKSRFESFAVTLLFGYSEAADVLYAAKNLGAARVSISEESLISHSMTPMIPPIDLIIRTGVEGDPHYSDYHIPLRTRNSQVVFSEILAPDFTSEHFESAIKDFSRRERRLGQ